MEPKEVQAFIRELGELPTLPSMAIRIMQMAVDPDTDMRAFARLIGQDQSLAAKVLRLANSPSFCGRSEVRDLQRAVSRLGTRMVRNLALSVMVFDLFDGPAGRSSNAEGASAGPAPLDMTELWKHAAGVALLAEEVARRAGHPQPDEAYVAGLLHDIGKVVLFHAAPQRSAEVMAALAADPAVPMIEMEDRVLGYNHAAIGRWLSHYWGFPAPLAQAIWLHHQPVTGAAEESRLTLPVLVRCANEIAHEHRLGASGNERVRPLMSRWQPVYGLSAADMESMAATALGRMQDLLEVLGMQADWRELYLALVRRANAEVSDYALQVTGQHRRLEARQRVLELASELASLDLAGLDLSGLLERVTRRVCEALELPGVTCLALEGEGELVTGIAFDRTADTTQALSIPVDAAALPEVRTLAGEGVDLSPMERLLLSDREVYRLGESLIRGIQKGTLLALPLVSGNARRGELLLDAGAVPEELTDELRALADVVALSLERFFRLQEIQRQAEELAAAARRVEETELQLYHNERLASVGRLAAGAAHEINNPLAIISGNAEMLRRTSDPDKQRRFVDKIVEQSQRIDKIIKDLMGFARPAQPDTAPTVCADMVQHVIELVGHRISTKDVEFVTQFPADLPLVRVDSRQIEQVLLNLVVNAIQAMPEGGRITISAAPRADGQQVELKVADTGHGIPKRHLAQIFDPFFTTKDDQHGTGLGLAVAHSIVRNHGGTLTVESVEGEGTTFFLCLPVDPSSEVRAMQARMRVVSGAETPSRTARVLLVDDEDDLRRVVAQFLSEEGYQVAEARDGMEGLQRLSTGDFDVVLLDIRMPRKDGLSLLGSIADTMPQLPVIVVTGLVGQELEEARKAGAFACVRKPFELAQLLDTVERAVASRRTRKSKNNGVA